MAIIFNFISLAAGGGERLHRFRGPDNDVLRGPRQRGAAHASALTAFPVFRRLGQLICQLMKPRPLETEDPYVFAGTL